MGKIKKLKIKKANGKMSAYIPIGVDAENIDFSDGGSLENKLDTLSNSIDTTNKELRTASASLSNLTKIAGTKIELSVNSDYVLTVSLKGSNEEILSSGTVDLPLESVVVNGRYDQVTKSLILTLENGQEINIAIEDIINGLATTVELSNLQAKVDNNLNTLETEIKERKEGQQTLQENINKKEDAVEGKGLSTNDFTNAYKTKLDGIANSANNYSLPTAAKDTLGGVKTTSTVTNITGYAATPIVDGVPYYKIPGNATSADSGLISGSDKAKLDTIEEGANKYTLPTASSTQLGGVKTGSNITNTNGTISLTKDNVTAALGYTPPQKDTAYGNASTEESGLMTIADKIKLDGIEAAANNYSLPAATGSALGGVKVGSNITNTNGTISLTKSNVTSALGYTPPTTNTTYTEATTETSGLMSAADKIKLDEIESTKSGASALDIYPVGAIYLSTTQVNPASLFGGTWAQIKDRFLLTAGDTYTNGSLGGEASHTLTSDEMPKHIHSFTGTAHGHTFTGTKVTTTSNGNHSHTYTKTTNTYASNFDRTFNGYGVDSYNSSDTATNSTGAHTHDVTASGTISNTTAGGTIGETGGGKAHNNMPPYLVVYAWQRTA